MILFTILTMKFNFFFTFLIIGFLLSQTIQCRKRNKRNKSAKIYTPRPTKNLYTKKICLQLDQTLKARHKSCFLRPDTGPCRADILQWYYDVRQSTCYRFFWGGCQGNGNRFETKEDCIKYCELTRPAFPKRVPYFCSLAFDYGTCFGHFNRWAWDSLSKSCRRRMYSGCGGNQNNFQTRGECISTCLNPPNNTLERSHSFTTCIPLILDHID